MYSVGKKTASVHRDSHNHIKLHVNQVKVGIAISVGNTGINLQVLRFIQYKVAAWQYNGRPRVQSTMGIAYILRFYPKIGPD